MEKEISLIEIMNKGKPLEIKRATSVKMSLRGDLEKEIASFLEVSVQFVRKWKGIYFAEGASGLLLKYKGSEGYLSEKEKLEVIDYIKEHEHIELEQLIKHVWETYGVEYNSKKSYYDLLHEGGKSWKKTQQWNTKYSQEKVDECMANIKKKLLEELENIVKEEVVVYVIDEGHVRHGDSIGYVWGDRNKRMCVEMENHAQSETFFGALNYLTGEFFIKSYPIANGKNTVNFVEWLREKQPEARSMFVWDNASYHKYGEFRDYLIEKNKRLREEDWKITCLNFAPNAPQENPVEDIWLQLKTWLRKNYYQYETFERLIGDCYEFFKSRIFNFKKTWLKLFSV